MQDFQKVCEIDARRMKINISQASKIKSYECHESERLDHVEFLWSMVEILSVLYNNNYNTSIHDGTPYDVEKEMIIGTRDIGNLLLAIKTKSGLVLSEHLKTIYHLDDDATRNQFYKQISEFSIDYVASEIREKRQRKREASFNSAVSVALTLKKRQKLDLNVFIIVDSRVIDNSVLLNYALKDASQFKLDNLIVIMIEPDNSCVINHANNSGIIEADPFSLESCHDYDTWVVDRHCVKSIDEGLNSAIKAELNGKPKIILVRFKDEVKFLCCDRVAQLDEELRLGSPKIKATKMLRDSILTQKISLTDESPSLELGERPSYGIKSRFSTNQAFGFKLAKLGDYTRRLFELGHPKADIYLTDIFRNMFPQRFISLTTKEIMYSSCCIAGLPNNSMVFMKSPIDHIRWPLFGMLNFQDFANININMVGYYSISEFMQQYISTPSHKRLQTNDLETFHKELKNFVIFYPSDAVSTERAVELAAQLNQPTYTRLSLEPSRIVYSNEEIFETGKAKVVREHGQLDQALVICAGIILSCVIEAADNLAREFQIYIRVMDLFTIRPIDRSAIIKNVNELKRVLIVEDLHVDQSISPFVIPILKNDCTSQAAWLTLSTYTNTRCNVSPDKYSRFEAMFSEQYDDLLVAEIILISLVDFVAQEESSIIWQSNSPRE